MTESQLNNSSLDRIALLISMYFPPEPGGGATTAWNRALILRKIGYSVFVLCGFPSYPTGKVNDAVYKRKFFYLEKMENITLLRLRLLPLESKGLLKRFILFMNFIFISLIWLPKILRISKRTELVYALAPNFFSCLIGFIYSKVTKSFFIYEVSAFWPEELIAFSGNLYFLLRYCGNFFVKVLYTLPDMIIVISELARDYVTKNYGPKVLVYTLHIGVEPSRFPSRLKESSRKELIEKKILPSEIDNKFIVLYSGVLSKITRVDSLAYAAAELKNDPDIAILIVGEGEEKEKLNKIRDKNNLSNLFVLPFQASSIVPHLIYAADVCVVPLANESIYETTVPTKFYDYLACRKPQIGICRGELERLISSNNIGITVDDGDIVKIKEAITHLRNSPATVKMMAENSARLLKDFTLDNLASKFSVPLKKEILKKSQETDEQCL
jgi:glycosyltransferase involved in cell wall biosynthesis